ncbi:MAG: hypothetical protein ACC635_00120 [Acidiferrobacterales bacterium]
MITKAVIENKYAGSFSKRQQLFFKYTYAILIDLTVLNLFNQYWDYVFIQSFMISLLVAILLQVLLQATLIIEHRVANYFKTKPGLKAKVLRGLSTWAILFISKLVILEAVNISFGDSVLFSGPIQGLVAFIIVVSAILVVEQAMSWIYKSLAK